MTDMTVANTIADQLGGIGKVKLMTGATNFLGSEDSLSIHLRPSTTKGRANRIVIRLTPADLYEVTTYKFNRRTLSATVVESRPEVYAEDLIDAFEEMTGLYLTFRARRA